MSTYERLPDGLPEPHDDGATDHLLGMTVPSLSLPSTSGNRVNLATAEGLAVGYVYPMTGSPGVPLPDG